MDAEELRNLCRCALALLSAAEVSNETLWSPVALSLRLDEEKLDRVRIARRTTLMCCLALLWDPTSIAQSHLALHSMRTIAAATPCAALS